MTKLPTNLAQSKAPPMIAERPAQEESDCGALSIGGDTVVGGGNNSKLMGKMMYKQATSFKMEKNVSFMQQPGSNSPNSIANSFFNPKKAGQHFTGASEAAESLFGGQTGELASEMQDPEAVPNLPIGAKVPIGMVKSSSSPHKAP